MSGRNHGLILPVSPDVPPTPVYSLFLKHDREGYLVKREVQGQHRSREPPERASSPHVSGGEM